MQNQYMRWVNHCEGTKTAIINWDLLRWLMKWLVLTTMDKSRFGSIRILLRIIPLLKNRFYKYRDGLIRRKKELKIWLWGKTKRKWLKILLVWFRVNASQASFLKNSLKKSTKIQIVLIKHSKPLKLTLQRIKYLFLTGSSIWT